MASTPTKKPRTRIQFEHHRHSDTSHNLRPSSATVDTSFTEFTEYERSDSKDEATQDESKEEARIVHQKTSVEKRVGMSATFWSEQKSLGLAEQLRATVKITPFKQSRVAVAEIVSSRLFQNAMLLAIIVNLGLVIYEIDQQAKCYPEYKNNVEACPTFSENITELYVANLSLLTLYSIEVCLLLYAHMAKFFTSIENLLDLCIVISGWISLLLGTVYNFGWLRIFKLGKYLSHPCVCRFQELTMLLRGFKGSMKAIAFGALFIVMALLFGAILAVSYVHPTNVEIDYSTINCDRCSRGYETVAGAFITLFQQIVAGDNWGQISVPNIEKDWKGAILLPTVHLFIGLGVMNLILAVIVDCAADARETKREEALAQKAEDIARRKLELVSIFEAVDVDSNGQLDYMEVQDAYRDCPEFYTLILHSGLYKKDLLDVFEYIDTDHDGEVSYCDFCDAVEDASHREGRVLSALTRMNVRTLQRRFDVELDKVDKKLDAIDSFMQQINLKLDYLLPGASKLDHLLSGIRKHMPPSKEVSFGDDDKKLGTQVRTLERSSLTSVSEEIEINRTLSAESRSSGDVRIPERSSLPSCCDEDTKLPGAEVVTGMLQLRHTMRDMSERMRSLEVSICRRFGLEDVDLDALFDVQESPSVGGKSFDISSSQSYVGRVLQVLQERSTLEAQGCDMEAVISDGANRTQRAKATRFREASRTASI